MRYQFLLLHNKLPQYLGYSHSRSVVSNSLRSHGLMWPTRLLCPCNSRGKNSGVGSHSLFQGILLTRGSNPGLPRWRQILYHLGHQGSPLGYRERLNGGGDLTGGAWNRLSAGVLTHPVSGLGVAWREGLLGRGLVRGLSLWSGYFTYRSLNVDGSEPQGQFQETRHRPHHLL